VLEEHHQGFGGEYLSSSVLHLMDEGLYLVVSLLGLHIENVSLGLAGEELRIDLKHKPTNLQDSQVKVGLQKGQERSKVRNFFHILQYRGVLAQEIKELYTSRN